MVRTGMVRLATAPAATALFRMLLVATVPVVSDVPGAVPADRRAQAAPVRRRITST